jgi:hypothetical protein
MSRAQCVASTRGADSGCTDDLQKEKERQQGYSADDRQDRQDRQDKRGDGEGGDGVAAWCG